MRLLTRLSPLLAPAILICVLRASPAPAQAVGPEFRVNSATTDRQRNPFVAADPSGSFVVVWQGFTLDGSNYGIFGHRYGSAGAPLGAEFRVNTYTSNGQGFPSVTSDSGGELIVVWQSIIQDGSLEGIFGQRYGSAGTPLGTEFRVNTYTTINQRYPSVSSDSGGSFVVVWESGDQDGSLYGIFGRRYGSTGAPLGPEFPVNSYTTGNQRYPLVTSDPGGNFVVVWHGNTQDGASYGAGASLAAEFRANTYTTSFQGSASVASNSGGSFVVVWQSLAQDASIDGVFGQRYGSAGAPLGPEFRVNTYTTNFQAHPSVSDSGGSFVVVWRSYAQDGALYGVFGQRYGSAGAPLGPEFRVNTYTTNLQSHPSVAGSSGGSFVVVWQSYLQNGSFYEVFGQRYCPTLDSVTVSVNGTTTVCSGGTGGTVTVTDSGGGPGSHQWFYRALPGGMYVTLNGQTGVQYVIQGSDFAGVGLYAVVCQTTPTCGSQMTSAENVQVTVTTSDGVPPSVTAPGGQTVTQTLCQ